MSIEENVRKVVIKELDLNDLAPKHDKDFKNGLRLVLIGKPGSGKSSVIKSILYAKKHILEVGQVFSGTEAQNGFFKTFIPDIFIYNGLDMKNLQPMKNFGKRQELAIAQLEPRGFNPWGFQVIDDCTHDKSFLSEEYCQKVYKYGRHWRMLHLLSLQYSLDIKPDIRACIDGVFIFREINPDQRERLWRNFGSGTTKSEFCDLLDQLTDDYMCIFINNKIQSNNVEDIVFFYKADLNRIPSDWKMCSPACWKFNEERYDKDRKENFF
jgi:energy-coupling factor transporter ATP-binding protein EcfA2